VRAFDSWQQVGGPVVGRAARFVQLPVDFVRFVERDRTGWNYDSRS
jgi:hypothetical protein